MLGGIAVIPVLSAIKHMMTLTPKSLTEFFFLKFSSETWSLAQMMAEFLLLLSLLVSSTIVSWLFFRVSYARRGFYLTIVLYAIMQIMLIFA